MTSLVTGGTGYLGSRLVETLLARGDRVRVLRRPASDVSLVSGAATLLEGNVTDPPSLLRAAEGCDRIFHVAALVKTWTRNPSDFDRINVEGTVNVCRTAQDLGCRLVYTSSFFALGPTGTEAVNEDHVRAGESYCTEYERTKTLADRRVRDFIHEGANIVVLYPCMIYGPGPLTQGNYVSGLVRDFLRGRLPGIPGSGKQRWTYSHIDNVIQGHLAAADTATPGDRFILGGPVVSIEGFLQVLERISGKKGPRFHLPLQALNAAGWMGEKWASVTGIVPQVTRGVVETYRHHWVYDCSRAQARLAYRPKPLEEGLREVVDYLRSFSS